MILQTIQPVSVLESLQKDSIVFSRPDYSEYDGHADYILRRVQQNDAPQISGTL